MPAEASPLKVTIQDNVKDAMRAKDKDRLNVLRQITASIKQVEVDNRADLSDDDIIVILTKMTKQRREALDQYENAGRDDLASIEKAELVIIEEFLPEALSEEEIAEAVQAAITEAGASSIKDMGAVMNVLRPKIQGRADMSAVSGQVKAALSN
ncbi:GatB/YqeY domain-containing protein [Methylophaga thiooxydans]|uniref:GatB/Yqey domain superfamily n=1 Tax=Methylophaga thiooxydans DMS010 TaxID=637616 RepID=C0N577_9GAMM|nr:GatB/YqeY domain-containing protein [Methylophaga thiooxydans]EEF80052.1 GatB/Yqey domain superfamily [Methylophaga thiooxydans DMS010]|mmetsp:Transcript_8437/g.14275  ORF Transcript_8437/g.14275 Transcript_8437/m.14275 type:complete len:154 (+) Transcript_8437:261-722(+)